ncbi:MAG: hypothetical protein LBF16_01060 [Pseudomonadales bacterium]|jgi:hypothetical protein|nr:hypothetical protein [Pseudomonadales bacterium]
MIYIKKLLCLSLLMIFIVNIVDAQDYRIKGQSSDVALTEFFGDTRGNYILPDRSVIDQLSDMGVPQEEDRVRGASTINSVCRQHVCSEKLAVVYDGDGKIQAAGLVHHACSPDPAKNGGYDCSRVQHFTMFVPFKEKSLDAEILLLEWAHRHLAPEVGVRDETDVARYLGNDKSRPPEGTIFEIVTLQ